MTTYFLRSADLRMRSKGKKDIIHKTKRKKNTKKWIEFHLNVTLQVGFYYFDSKAISLTNLLSAACCTKAKAGML